MCRRFQPLGTGRRLDALDLAEQFLRRTFGHALCHRFDHAPDLARFEARIDNAGAPACPPAMLLEVILRACTHGILARRAIARACHHPGIFVALSDCTQAHITTIVAWSANSATISPLRSAPSSPRVR